MRGRVARVGSGGGRGWSHQGRVRPKRVIDDCRWLINREPHGNRDTVHTPPSGRRPGLPTDCVGIACLLLLLLLSEGGECGLGAFASRGGQRR